MTDDAPLVSVVMPTFNSENYVAETIESVLNQTFTDFEFIIVDDGSTDHSVQVMRGFTDPRIVLLENGKNLGISATLNHGIATARGKYIARMDSDDICVVNRLQLQVEFMEAHPHIGISGGHCIKFYQSRNESITDHYPQSPAQIRYSILAGRIPFLHPTVIMHRSLFLAGYRYQEGTIAEDCWLFADLFVGNVQMANIPHVLLYYRRHSQNISSKRYEYNRNMSNNGRFIQWWAIFSHSPPPSIQGYDSFDHFIQKNDGFVLGKLSSLQAELPLALKEYGWTRAHSRRFLRNFLRLNITDIHRCSGEQVSVTVLTLFLAYRVKALVGGKLSKSDSRGRRRNTRSGIEAKEKQHHETSDDR